MEILGIIFLIIAYQVVVRLFFKGARVAAEGVKSAVTGQEFDMDKALGRIPPFAMQVVERNTEEDGSGINYYAVEVKGLFPVERSTEAAFVVSLFDITDGKDDLRPVLSLLDNFQEVNTTAHCNVTQAGRIQPEYGLTKWTEVGRVFPPFVKTPYSGTRKLNVFLRLIHPDSIENIQLGFGKIPDDDMFWRGASEITIEQFVVGYAEEAENRQECLELTVKLGMVVAMADGSLDEPEGNVLNTWMKKSITPYNEERQVELKARLNDAMKEAYAGMLDGNLSKSVLTERFNEIGDSAAKFEAMDLFYDVMAADGVADPEEIKVLRRLGDALELDVQELEKLRDLKMMNLSSAVEEADNESLLGIDVEWSKEEIQKHLKAEFRKWNARLNNLQPGPDKEHAQKMLDTIGELRNKYD